MRQTVSLLLTLLALAQLAPATARAQAAADEPEAARQQPPAQHAPPLRNGDVEAMLDAGLSPEVVAAKIRASGCVFDTGAAALQRLKAKGASDALLLAFIEAAVAAQPAQSAPEPAAARVRLPAGTPVEVETLHALNSAEVRAGDRITLRVTKSIEVGGLTVIEAGAHAVGRIVRASRGRSFGRAGQLAWQLESVVAADGQKIPLSFAARAGRWRRPPC
jgi:hypothetical protein